MAKMKIPGWLTCGLAISLLIMLLPGTALAHGGGEGITVTIGEYQVSLTFAEPAKAGGNPLHVQILNGMGLPVSDAQVEVSVIPFDMQQHQENMEGSGHAMSGMPGMSHSPTAATAHDMSGMSDMDNMPGMSVINAAPTVALSNELLRKTGEYFGVITFSTAGHWLLNTHLSINGQTVDANFPVEVARDSSSLAILAGFVGLNALIIWAASVIKRRHASA